MGAARGHLVAAALPVMDLTTLERLKALLELELSDTTDDAALSALIASVSNRIERYLQRGVEQVERTEYFDLWRERERLQLYAWPVSAVSSVVADAQQDWANGTTLTEPNGYVLDPDQGWIRRPRSTLAYATLWPVGLRSLRVIYTGGLAVDTAAVLSDHPELARACETQAAEEWRRRKGMAATSRTVQGSTVQHEGGVTWLPVVLDMLADYRRVTF